MLMQGFRCWVLEANEPDSAQEEREQTPPIVFIHGVGLGVVSLPDVAWCCITRAFCASTHITSICSQALHWMQRHSATEML